MTYFLYYFFIFFIYSVIGWCIEMVSTYLYHHKLVNRGFLIGPYCPIYGTAAVLMILLLDKYQNDLPVLFVMAVVISSILEYLTSYVMEKIFKARWWDYSKRSFNVNGRICLTNCFAFGFLGVAVVAFVHPVIESIVSSIKTPYFYVLSTFCFTVFLIDFITSFKITLTLKERIANLKKDSTEEISKKVREKIQESSKLFYRILEAFPNLKPLVRKKKRKNFPFFK